MGKGDRKSKKGKIHIGTYGKRRPARLKKVSAPVAKKSKK
ncbi:MAG: 30S ribosomal protein THX [Bacteroidetes bacterium]|nr:30S ribosomal protein THX [Bacteroidota bacterium]